jgi:hypothetical protein
MKALMDEVRFEEGGGVVHMRKNTGLAAAAGIGQFPVTIRNRFPYRKHL